MKQSEKDALLCAMNKEYEDARRPLIDAQAVNEDAYKQTLLDIESTHTNKRRNMLAERNAHREAMIELLKRGTDRSEAEYVAHEYAMAELREEMALDRQQYYEGRQRAQADYTRERQRIECELRHLRKENADRKALLQAEPVEEPQTTTDYEGMLSAFFKALTKWWRRTHVAVESKE